MVKSRKFACSIQTYLHCKFVHNRRRSNSNNKGKSFSRQRRRQKLRQICDMAVHSRATHAAAAASAIKFCNNNNNAIQDPPSTALSMVGGPPRGRVSYRRFPPLPVGAPPNTKERPALPTRPQPQWALKIAQPQHLISKEICPMPRRSHNHYTPANREREESFCAVTFSAGTMCISKSLSLSLHFSSSSSSSLEGARRVAWH